MPKLPAGSRRCRLSLAVLPVPRVPRDAFPAPSAPPAPLPAPRCSPELAGRGGSGGILQLHPVMLSPAVPWPGSYLQQTVKSDHNDVTHSPTKDRSRHRSLRSPGCTGLFIQGFGLRFVPLALPTARVWGLGVPGSRCSKRCWGSAGKRGAPAQESELGLTQLPDLHCGSQKTPRGHLATEKRENHFKNRFLQRLPTFLFQCSPASCLTPTPNGAGLVQDTKRSCQDPNQDKRGSCPRSSSP